MVCYFIVIYATAYIGFIRIGFKKVAKFIEIDGLRGNQLSFGAKIRRFKQLPKTLQKIDDSKIGRVC